MNHVEAHERLESFHNLKPGWDSYGAPPISEIAMTCAKAMLFRLGDGWQPVPMSDGGVQLEGSHLGCYVEVVIMPEESLRTPTRKEDSK
jgi:hypothetical protein